MLSLGSCRQLILFSKSGVLFRWVTACRDFSLVIGLICGHHRCCLGTLFSYQVKQLLHLVHIQIMFFVLCSSTCHVTMKTQLLVHVLIKVISACMVTVEGYQY